MTLTCIICKNQHRWCLHHILINPHKGTWNMNKTELVDAIAAAADITKAEASKAIDAFCDSITEALVKGDKIANVPHAPVATRKPARH